MPGFPVGGHIYPTTDWLPVHDLVRMLLDTIATQSTVTEWWLILVKTQRQKLSLVQSTLTVLECALGTGCPVNADMATSGPHPERELSPLPSCNAGATAKADEPHASSFERFTVASDHEIAKLAEELVPLNMTSWGL